jgi:pSer/pThr/pTyr-binding forkhead associated (FHA) protein
MFRNGVVHCNKIEDIIVDFMLRCLNGTYKNRFIFINLTQIGETIGRDPLQNLTLCIDEPSLSPKHAEIKYNPIDKKYILKDCDSETGTWSKLRSEFPILIHNNMKFKIDNQMFEFVYDLESPFDEVL